MATEHPPKRKYTRRSARQSDRISNSVSAISVMDKTPYLSDNVAPDGMRYNFLPKEELKHDVERLREYRRLGYAIEERDYDYKLSIPQKQYEQEIEGKQHRDHRARMERSVRDPELGSEFTSTLSHEDTPVNTARLDEYLEAGADDD